jgi:hypothetical protein
VFANLNHIETLHIDENEFEGTIPDIFDQIYHLQEFLAQGNKLSGPIPQTITHMQSISKFGFFDNSSRFYEPCLTCSSYHTQKV